MRAKRKLSETFKNMSTVQKIELILALLITAALMILAPTAAWLSYRRNIVKLQKIQSPNTLILSAPHHEDRMYFKVEGINADENQVNGNGVELKDANNKPIKITHKDYVFCVVGEAVDQFTLQLAYTTNNPFTYEIYAAEEIDRFEDLGTIDANTEKDYVEYTPTNRNVPGIPLAYQADTTNAQTLYYRIDQSVTEGGANGQYTGSYLNRGTVDAHGSYDATNKYHTIVYPGYDENDTSYDHVHADAEPVYWQATGISAIPGHTNLEKEAFVRHFILRVKWVAGELDNDLKETDIVYITAKATK